MRISEKPPLAGSLQRTRLETGSHVPHSSISDPLLHLPCIFAGSTHCMDLPVTRFCGLDS